MELLIIFGIFKNGSYMPPLSKVEVKVFINKVRLPTPTPKNVEIFNNQPILFAKSFGMLKIKTKWVKKIV